MRLWAATILLCLVVASPAHGQRQACGPYVDVARILLDKFGASPLWQGTSANGAAHVLFVNPDRSYWTLVARLPNGTGCIEGSGNGWTEGDPTPSPDENPS